MSARPEFLVNDNGPKEIWYWHVVASNGEIVSHGEGHTSRRDAERAFVRATALHCEALSEYLFNLAPNEPDHK